MKTLRTLAGIFAALALVSPAWSEVRTIWPGQYLAPPPGQTFTHFGLSVAIDGGAIIVLTSYEGGQSALLYRRGTTTNNWTYRRTLASVTGPFQRYGVAMKNGLAAIQFGNQISIFEYSGGDYVRARSTAPIQHPGGVAISGNSVLVGGDGCDYDAVVYQKGTDGNWGITGRMDDNAGECHPEGLAVELNYDYALLRVPSTHQIAAWRRNGTALNWLPAGNLNVSPEIPVSNGPVALQKATAVTPASVVFRRTGNTWTEQGTVVPVDYFNGAGLAFDLIYRDGVLLTSEAWLSGNPARPYAYLESSPGHFEHVAILETPNTTVDHDISGRTVVASMRDWNGKTYAAVLFNLPEPLRAPVPILNDFETRDISGFTFSGGQFALAARGTDDVLAQSYANGVAVALINDSDLSDYQRIEADITPDISIPGGWAGVVARYVDADNYYFLAIRNDNTYGIYRRLNGANTMLGEGQYPGSNPARAVLTVGVYGIATWVNGRYNSVGIDRSLPRGRSGLATSQARADFDDVRAAATEELILLAKDYVAYGYDVARPFTELGGDWEVRSDETGNFTALSQLDISGSAISFIGVPVENQEIIARARLDAFGSSTQGAWFGLLARYVDARTHYYLTIRSTNQLQIRKQVNGVITVLASANFTATPGEFHEFRFRVVGSQLYASVDGLPVASARDGQITTGQYGIATYRAKATWENFTVVQP